MVYFKNVTGIMESLEQTKLADSTLDNIGTTAGIEVTGFLDYATPREIYETFNVELRNPMTLDVDLGDSAFYDFANTTVSEWQFTVTGPGPSGGSGLYTGTVWRIVGRPKVYDDGLQCDHCQFLFEQSTWAITAPAVPA